MALFLLLNASYFRGYPFPSRAGQNKAAIPPLWRDLKRNGQRIISQIETEQPRLKPR